jgi:Leucine-rich repeat (LRR) protein
VPDATVTLYDNGTQVGETEKANTWGSWTGCKFTDLSLNAIESLTATAQVPGETVSNASTAVTVGATQHLTATPTITTPVYANDTSVSGTATPGARIVLFDNGSYVGWALADAETEWTISVSTLAVNDSLTATAKVAGETVSAASTAVVDVYIPDTNLLKAINDALGNSEDEDAPITLSDMQNLTLLDASGYGISDLTGLQYATNLATLDLSDNQITDISALSGLTSLQTLDLSYNGIADIGDLSGLNLTTLYLGSDCITGISDVSLPELTYLDLDNNGIDSISGWSWSNLPVLQTLDLSYNYNNTESISDIGALSVLTNLTTLYLSSDSIIGISDVFLPELTYLDLDNNGIDSISGWSWSNLPVLQTLDLSSNCINDIGGLTKANLPKLTVLNVSNNYLDLDPTIMSEIYALEGNGVHVTFSPQNEG